MRSFLIALLALSLPISILASHGDYRARRHAEIALRARGDLSPRDEHNGVRATFYQINVGTTACGKNYQNNDFVVALSQINFGSGYPGPNCFKTITLTCNGKTANGVPIVDECQACPPWGLDLTPGLFSYFADQSVGVISCDWSFQGDTPPPPPPPPAPTTTSQPPPPPTTTYTPPPPPPKTSTYTPPPPTSTSTPAPAQTTSSPTTTSATSSSSKSAAASTSSSRNSTAGSTSGLAQPQPTGSAVPDGQTDNIADLTQVFVNLAGLVQACHPA